MRAEIGVAILGGVATFVAFLMLTYGRGSFYWPVTFLFTRGGIPSPFALCFFVGAALYISDRKDFSIRRSGDKLTATLFAILGFVLMAENSLEGLLILSGWGGLPSSWEEWMYFGVPLAYNGLALLSGALLLSDSDKMVEDKSRYQPPARRLEVETLTRYPRDLLAKYAEQYSHNPEGVLEWHIHKKVKKGKTREQAIKELRNIGDRSI